MKVRIIRNDRQKLGKYEVQYTVNDILVGETWQNVGKYKGGILLYFNTYDEAKECYDNFIQNRNDERMSVIEMTDLGDIN